MMFGDRVTVRWEFIPGFIPNHKCHMIMDPTLNIYEVMDRNLK